MSDSTQQRLQRASDAWTRIFKNTKPHSNTNPRVPQHRSNTIKKPITNIKTVSISTTTAPQTLIQQPINIIPENLHRNRSWGDSLNDKADDHSIRIYAQNLNGISLHKDGGQYKEICDILTEVKADIFCFQEHNLDTTKYEVKNILYETTRKHWQRARLTISSSPIQFTGTWKPGGTGILSTGPATGRILKTGHDPWGRWSYQTFAGKEGKQVTIISAYQVVAQRQALKGQFTTATQQHSLLLRQQDKITDPRTAFRRDLQSFLRLCTQEEGHDILLLGDFNERIGEDTNGMSRIATEFNLIDVMKLHHPHLDEVATYARGRKRLDFVLGSHNVATAIINCGYESFNYRYHTDHRAYFVDINSQLLFGSTPQSFAKFSERILHSNNIRQVTKYIQLKHKMLTACNAFNRGNQLENPDNRHLFAERLDADILRCSLSAEKQLKKYKDPPWSIELAEARRKVSILNKVLSMAKTGVDNTDLISSEMEQLATPMLFPVTISECSKALREAKREVSTIIQRSFSTRENEREKQIAHLEADIIDPKKSKAKAKILRNLKKAEELRKLFMKLKTLQFVRQRGGITRIEVPNNPSEDPKTCTQWKMVDIPTEILHHLQSRNQKHFGQAQGTPFTVYPLADELGFTSHTSCGALILDGQYDATHLDESVQSIIQHLTKTTYAHEHPLKPTITEATFLGKLQHWRESTSTSPSGLHLGHYKSMIARHEFSDLSDRDPRKATLESQRKDIIQLHLQLINYALSRGYSYSRWQQVANAMLYKEPGNYKIHRTRVIHLYEADYNLAMGLKWRAALEMAEEGHCLNSGQYGSRPSRGAHDPVFIEEFQLEISRASRKTLIQTNYDATSCYDRIIPNLAALVSRKYGVPQPVTLTNASTLEQAKYRLKTELGMSEQSYSHSEENPIYGTGQGSGNSPMIWCFLSSVLFDCYDERANGAIYELPDRSLSTKINMIGYVDDSNGQTNQFQCNQQPPASQILKLAQDDAQTWNDLLSASGGALELPKCVYQVLSWTFLSDGSPIPTGFDNKLEVKVLDVQQRSPQIIPGISSYTAHKTLGHYKDPAGEQNRQRIEIANKCQKATEFMINSPLTREEAWTYYFAIFQTSVGYPLAASHFTKKTLDKLQRRFMSILIARCGYNRKTKREILYGPACLGGANFRSLYSIQGVGQVTSFLKYWRSPSQAGKLLRIAVAWTQYTIGTSVSFLTDTNTPLPHMEVKWLKSLRDYLREIHGSIQLDNDYIPGLERVHDHHIMDAIIQSNQFTPKEIRQLNYCRLYLQAVTISDITTAKGDCLDPYFIQGNISHPSSSVTTWHHVTQERPQQSSWDLWRAANRLWSKNSNQLHQSLTRWLQPVSRQRRQWPVYANPSGVIYATLDTQDEQEYRDWRYSIHRWTKTQEDDAPSLVIPPSTGVGICVPKSGISEDAIPISITTGQSHGVITLNFKTQQLRAQASYWKEQHRLAQSLHSYSDFQTYTNNLDDWEAELLSNLQMKHDAHTTLHYMRQGFLAASDGSVQHTYYGAFGWTISTRKGERIVRANGPVRGYRPTSYRAEGYGLLSVMRFVVNLIKYCKEDTLRTQWEVTSDNISLVDQINGQADDDSPNRPQAHVPHDWSVWHDLSPSDIEEIPPAFWAASEQSTTNITLHPDWDVLNEIRWTMVHCVDIHGCTISHIKGHQDNKQRYNKLTLRAQLNVDADQLAAEYQAKHGQSLPTVLMFPHTAAQLHLTHGTCTSHIPSALRTAETSLPLAKYIRTRNQWTQQQFDSVNWDALQQAIKKKNRSRIHITKLVHDILPTNKTVHRQNPKAQRCQQCNECPQEDRDHIMRCGEDQRALWRADTIVTIESRCKTLHTDPALTRILVSGINLWFQGKETVSFSDVNPKYHRLVAQQNSIGWRQLFNGRMSTEWARLQDDYYFISKQRTEATATSTHTKDISASRYTRSGTNWTGEIIVTLWDQWLKIWTIRNKAIHGHDRETREKHQIEVDIQRLQTIYKQRRQLEPSVQELLFDTLEEHQRTRGPQAIRNWLSITEPVVMQSLKNVAKRALQGVRSIRTYFNPSIVSDQTNPQAHSNQNTRPTHTPLKVMKSTSTQKNSIASYFATGRPPGQLAEENYKPSTEVSNMTDNKEQSENSTPKTSSPA